MRKIANAAVALLLTASVPATAAPPPLPWKDAAPQPRALSGGFADAVMAPVVVSLPGMDRVRFIRDLRYRQTDEPEVRMDLYLPPSSKGPVPIVLFVHGGSNIHVQPKDWGIYQSWGRLAAASGMAGVTFTQHLGFPETAIPQAADDVAAAVTFVRTNARRYGLNADRVCIVVYSAGGPMLAPYLVNAAPWLKCLVGWYPFMDIRQSSFHRTSETPQTLDAYSNILKLDQPGPKTPLYLVRAGDDQIATLKDSIDRFTAKALETDYPLTLANAPGAPHGFDNQVDLIRTHEIVLGTLQFLRGRLGLDRATAPADRGAAGTK